MQTTKAELLDDLAHANGRAHRLNVALGEATRDRDFAQRLLSTCLATLQDVTRQIQEHNEAETRIKEAKGDTPAT